MAIWTPNSDSGSPSSGWLQLEPPFKTAAGRRPSQARYFHWALLAKLEHCAQRCFLTCWTWHQHDHSHTKGMVQGNAKPLSQVYAACFDGTSLYRRYIWVYPRGISGSTIGACHGITYTHLCCHLDSFLSYSHGRCQGPERRSRLMLNTKHFFLCSNAFVAALHLPEVADHLPGLATGPDVPRTIECPSSLGILSLLLSETGSNRRQA